MIPYYLFMENIDLIGAPAAHVGDDVEMVQVAKRQPQMHEDRSGVLRMLTESQAETLSQNTAWRMPED